MSQHAMNAAGAGFLGRVGHRFVEWWSNGAQASELDRLPPAEVASIAHDLGLSSDDLRQLVSTGEDSTPLLNERLRMQGIDLDQLGPVGRAVRHDMERTCSLCESHGVCQHDQQAHPEGREWRRYCPNVTTMDALKAQFQPTPKSDDKACCCGGEGGGGCGKG